MKGVNYFLVSQSFWVARRSSSILCLSINGLFVSELISLLQTGMV
ncbi:hypothetical protein LEP1GSC049_0352 [Leptospira kirschneri serovar Cynopteri str. 3522 CT]|nr:hypothetical protein LEP1GSC049_0352 [Leptospira kirschneri serovar Cynopteri str. 3522 CT]